MTNYRIIENLRPRDLSGVVPDWEQRQAEILREITSPTEDVAVSGRPAKLRRRTVLRVGIAAAAAAIVVAGVAPIVLPQGSPPARADLEVLADNARAADPGLTIGPGQYLYIHTEQEQTSPPPDPSQMRRMDENAPPVPTAPLHDVMQHEMWLAPDGSVAIRLTSGDSLPEAGAESEVLGPYPSTGLKQTAEAPRDPAELERWVRSQLPEQQSKEGKPANQDRVVFKELTEMLSQRNPDPELRAIILETMQRLPHVSVETGQQDSLGRPSVALSYDDPTSDRHSRYYFSPTTGQFLEETTSLPGGGSYRGTRVEERIVDFRPS